MIKINKEIKITDVISYLVIIILLIFYILEIRTRNKLLYLNSELRLQNCKTPNESITLIINEFINGNYEVIENITQNMEVKK